MNSQQIISVWILVVLLLTRTQASAADTDQRDARDASGPAMGSLYDYARYGLPYDDGTLEIPALGMTVSEDSAKLSTGEHVNGVAILAVAEASPACDAGLGKLTGRAQAAVVVAPIAEIALLVLYPPAADAVAEGTQGVIAHGRDVIIAVDSNRTRNLPEFYDAIQNASPGEIVYLTVIRGGRRVFLSVPADSTYKWREIGGQATIPQHGAESVASPGADTYQR